MLQMMRSQDMTWSSQAKRFRRADGITRIEASFARSNRFRAARRRDPRAFTLIELLVVIAVIALLVAIILPSFGAAKKLAQNTATENRIQQLNIGATSYYADDKKHYPGGDLASLTQLANGDFTGSQILALRLLGVDDSGDPIDGAGSYLPDNQGMLGSYPDLDDAQRNDTLMDAFNDSKPILYYPARRMFTATLQVYHPQDNPYRGWNPSDDDFRALIERAPDRPVNPQTYLLMGQGKDGRYGTPDDNRNYTLGD
jgi:prepilin-type N-terminal cleavage/methylation domain-containing protein